jgi:serine/threonine-protein kinase HipA
MANEKIAVSIDMDNRTMPIGSLWFHSQSKRGMASFEYNEDWLAYPRAFPLEPDLPLTRGVFHTREGLFGAMEDSAPDRWGGLLMRRNETRRAKAAGVAPRNLSEFDYLLGVNDEARQGSLRFSREVGGPFLAADSKSAIPPLVALPKLLSASERFLSSDENDEDLRLLLAPGSSLGGARPKASILDRDNSLAIAKFPRKEDDYNAVLWEALALTLAEKAGISVPSRHLEQVLKKPVLIIRRFDRRGKQRLPFLSAMSMLGAKDNEEHSYLEIAYAIAQYGSTPEKDLAELWRRMVFTILISNTDDHLRNHGFLHDGQKGWRLSPVYDINPTPFEVKPRVLSTAIDFTSREASLETALSVIKEFRLGKEDAHAIIRAVFSAVRDWRSGARTLGIGQGQIAHMASAFEHEDAEIAEGM